MNHSASSLSDFCHPESAVPLQYGNPQPPAASDGGACATFPAVLKMTLGFQHEGCCRESRELILLVCHQSLFFLKYSLLVTYYDNFVLNSKCTKFNNH